MKRSRFDIFPLRTNVPELFIIWLFALFFEARRPGALRENNALQLANQSARYIAYKNKPYNNSS